MPACNTIYHAIAPTSLRRIQLSVSSKKKNEMKTILIFTALDIEYNTVRNYLDNIEEVVFEDGTICEKGLYKNLEIYLRETGKGNYNSALSTDRILKILKPDTTLFIGIAGGIKDVNVGDIVVGEKIYGYESGKAGKDFQARPELGLSSFRLLERAKQEARKVEWKLSKQNVSKDCKVVIGNIAAGEKVVVDDTNQTYDLIRNNYNDAIALEMEGYGFMKAIHENEISKKILIRGISDTLTNKQEMDGKNMQQVACDNAAAFSFHLIDKLISVSDSISHCEKEDTYQIKLENNLNDSLQYFTNQPIVWVEPIISDTNDISSNPDENNSTKIEYSSIISDESSIIIQAPPQFGLTSLSHFLELEAYKSGETWVRICCKETKPRKCIKHIQRDLATRNLNEDSLNCILIDSWLNYRSEDVKILKTISDNYQNVRIILFQTIDDSEFQSPPEKIELERNFKTHHLLALNRTKLRNLITQYNAIAHIAEDKVLISKILGDLENLNIHRTPFNSITLLKASEKYFTESPVNRTAMIEMVLFVLFNLDSLPTYSTKPDRDDCEFVLGNFCEILLKRENYYFTKSEFLEIAKSYCEEKFIELDIEIVYDILISNNIMIEHSNLITFRSKYWTYYFLAKRMHHSKDFKSYILNEKRYTSYPEIIEFYTGIERNSDETLEILTLDLIETSETVKTKLGFPEKMNPLKLLQWRPTEENIEVVKEDLGNNVNSSKLPTKLKDQYADRTYNQLQPYNQTIYKILEEYSLLSLMMKVKASSRALRNSDYSDPELKKKTLDAILRGWEQITRVLFALTPMLTSNGEAEFGGMNFVLTGKFGETTKERFKNILMALPTNTVGMFKDDIYSEKIGPLLIDRIQNESNDLNRHGLMLLLIFQRPSGWKNIVEDYIVNNSKNSFYIYDIVNAMKAQYKFSFADDKSINHLHYLIKMGLAKHHFGVKKPGLSKIRKIPNKNLPKRLNK